MKKLIMHPEEIYAMTTIGKSYEPVFEVSVNPEPNRKGDCYFKVYDAHSYTKAKHVARVRFDSSKYIKPHKGIPVQELDRDIRVELDKFLRKPSENIPGVSNWDYAKFAWNLEKNLLDDPVENTTRLQAYLSGQFDTEDNLSNPDYIPSTLIQPDYTQISK